MGKASVAWLTSLLPGGAVLSADEVEGVLTDLGFPIDGREAVGADTRLEVEVTSNRGDCLCHVGLARELGARLGRRVEAGSAPAVRTSGERAGDLVSLENRAPEACPRFTLRVIRGVRVGPSPAWLVERLESVGQRSINNVVDVTNWLNFHYGQPCHAFDLAKLGKGKDGKPAVVVRWAEEGEGLTTLDGRARKLKRDELVVADGARAQGLAGVIGGGDSEVSAGTRDIALEVATWDPVTVRRAARRHQVRTDASHRYERIVDARTIDGPAAHAAALIAELTGGAVCEGAVESGAAGRPLRELTLRLRRIEEILGVAPPAGAILAALGCEVVRAVDDALVVRVPAWRPDLEREIDLIEEVGRVHGLDRVPVGDRVRVVVRGPQRAEAAARAVADALTGLGFYETVTFSFCSPKAARALGREGVELLSVDDSRRKEEPTLRPSVLPSLLQCRKANQDAQVSPEGGVRLYEMAAVFGERGGAVDERRVLALLMDVPGVAPGKAGTVEQRQAGVRLLRGAVEAACRAARGEVRVEVVPGDIGMRGFEAGAAGVVMVDGARVGVMGVIDAATQRAFEVTGPVCAAELELSALVEGAVRRRAVEMPPAFPGIERDVSVIVGEDVSWGRIESAVVSARLERMVGVGFVTTYRGKPLEAGKKSVTLRMTFRDPTRTLRDEEVNPEVERLVKRLGEEVGAVVRTV